MCLAVQFDTFFPSSSSSSKHYLFTYIKRFSMKHLSLRIVNIIKQQHAIQTQILCNVEIQNIFNCSQRDYIFFSFHSQNSSSIEWFWFCCEKKRKKIIKLNKVVLLFYQNEWMILIRLCVLIIKTEKKIRKV